MPTVKRAQSPAQASCRPDRAADLQQLGRVENRTHLGPPYRRAHVVGTAKMDTRLGFEQSPRLGRLGDRLARHREPGFRSKSQNALLAGRERRPFRHADQDLVEFQGVESFLLDRHMRLYQARNCAENSDSSRATIRSTIAAISSWVSVAPGARSTIDTATFFIFSASGGPLYTSTTRTSSSSSPPASRTARRMLATSTSCGSTTATSRRAAG